jgi:hypothetical protein
MAGSIQQVSTRDLGLVSQALDGTMAGSIQEVSTPSRPLRQQTGNTEAQVSTSAESE